MRPRRAARTQVMPAEMINPMPGMRTTVPRTSMGISSSGRVWRRKQDADAEQDQHDSYLDGGEYPGYGVWHAL